MDQKPENLEVEVPPAETQIDGEGLEKKVVLKKLRIRSGLKGGRYACTTKPAF